MKVDVQCKQKATFTFEQFPVPSQLFNINQNFNRDIQHLALCGYSHFYFSTPYEKNSYKDS